MSVDPHPRTPHAVLWLLVDRWSDIYAFREIWPSKAYPTDGQWIQLREDDQDNIFETREYCDMIAKLEGNRLEWRGAETDRERAKYVRTGRGETIARRFMDQAGKGFAAVIEGSTETYDVVYRRYGLTFLDPFKAHTLGEDSIREALRPRRHEFKGMWPRLHIAASCKELIAEFPKHRYKVRRTPSEEADMKQEARTKRTHMLDNLRYLMTSRPGYRQNRACERFEMTHG